MERVGALSKSEIARRNRAHSSALEAKRRGEEGTSHCSSPEQHARTHGFVASASFAFVLVPYPNSRCVCPLFLAGEPEVGEGAPWEESRTVPKRETPPAPPTPTDASASQVAQPGAEESPLAFVFCACVQPEEAGRLDEEE